MQHETFRFYGRCFCCRIILCGCFTLVHIQHAHDQDLSTLLCSSVGGRLTAKGLLNCPCFLHKHLAELKTALRWLRVSTPAQSNNFKHIGLVDSMLKPQSTVKISLLYLVSLIGDWVLLLMICWWQVECWGFFPPGNLDLWGLRALRIVYVSIFYSPGIPLF